MSSGDPVNSMEAPYQSTPRARAGEHREGDPRRGLEKERCDLGQSEGRAFLADAIARAGL